VVVLMLTLMLMLPALFVILTSTVLNMSAVQWSLAVLASSKYVPVLVMTSNRHALCDGSVGASYLP
jgi:hypothetical protein